MELVLIGAILTLMSLVGSFVGTLLAWKVIVKPGSIEEVEAYNEQVDAYNEQVDNG